MANETVRGCCSPLKGLTRLTFQDGGQVAIVGLDEVLAAVYTEGRQVTMETGQEILKRVEAKNYIACSIREEYESLLLREYRKYVAGLEANEKERR